MADLHIFGDSYSVDWEQVKKKVPWTNQAKYYRWLGKTPEHFSNLIKDEFKLNKIHNYAIGGFDNYSILESLITAPSKVLSAIKVFDPPDRTKIFTLFSIFFKNLIKSFKLSAL